MAEACCSGYSFSGLAVRFVMSRTLTIGASPEVLLVRSLQHYVV